MKQLDGFDECVIGTANICRDETTVEVLVYSVDAMLEILHLRDNMDQHEAMEFFLYNIEGLYIGIDTPVLVYSNPNWKKEL